MSTSRWSSLPSRQVVLWCAAGVALAVAFGLSNASEAAPISFDESIILGEVLKPEITVVISRENLNKAYELKLDENFLDKIINSVEAPPF